MQKQIYIKLGLLLLLVGVAVFFVYRQFFSQDVVQETVVIEPNVKQANTISQPIVQPASNENKVDSGEQSLAVSEESESVDKNELIQSIEEKNRELEEMKTEYQNILTEISTVKEEIETVDKKIQAKEDEVSDLLYQE